MPALSSNLAVLSIDSSEFSSILREVRGAGEKLGVKQSGWQGCPDVPNNTQNARGKSVPLISRIESGRFRQRCELCLWIFQRQPVEKELFYTGRLTMLVKKLVDSSRWWILLVFVLQWRGKIFHDFLNLYSLRNNL